MSMSHAAGLHHQHLDDEGTDAVQMPHPPDLTYLGALILEPPSIASSGACPDVAGRSLTPLSHLTSRLEEIHKRQVIP